MTKSILAVIPARSGSKGLPYKNILDLVGKPLIAWSIESSLKSKYINKTLVSSDSDEILNISSEYGASTLKRPKELATDTASSESVVKHVIDSISERFDYIILLQPTSPLRNTEHIDNAFNNFFKNNATALISVRSIDNKILKAFIETDTHYIRGISNNKYPFTRRQELPKTYMSNGAIYIIKTSEFVRNNSFFTDKTVHYVMNKESGMDIDTADDLKVVNDIILSDGVSQ